MYKRLLADVEIKKKLEGLKKNNQSNLNDEDIQYILKRLDKMRTLQEKLNTHIIDSAILDEYLRLKEIGKQQVITQSATVTPLAVNFGGLPRGNLCCPDDPYYCSLCDYPKQILSDDFYASPWTHAYGFATFYNLQPIGVWVGIYETPVIPPDERYYWGMYCTDEFPSTNNPDELWSMYWLYAVSLYEIETGSSQFEDFGSIQIKFFYDGTAYNYFTGQYQTANLIYQYNCNKNGCYKSDVLDPLPSNPQYHPSPYTDTVYIYVKVLACCNGGLVGSTCKWANRHCDSCFAPDESKSQNFPYEG